MAVELCAQLYKGVGQGGGQTDLLDDLFDNGLGGGEATVCQHTYHILGQILTGSNAGQYVYCHEISSFGVWVVSESVQDLDECFLVIVHKWSSFLLWWLWRLYHAAMQTISINPANIARSARM